jgi:hypothetical protein
MNCYFKKQIFSNKNTSEVLIKIEISSAQKKFKCRKKGWNPTNELLRIVINNEINFVGVVHHPQLSFKLAQNYGMRTSHRNIQIVPNREIHVSQTPSDVFPFVPQALSQIFR